jgi:hypothetical protein
LCIYVTSHCLADAPQSGAKEIFLLYCLLHNFKFKLGSLESILKFEKKMSKIELEAKINA